MKTDDCPFYICLFSHCISSIKVPYWKTRISRSRNYLFFIRSPSKIGNWPRMTKAFSNKLNLILVSNTIHEDFICFSTECYKSSTRAYLYAKTFVWIFDLSDWLGFIAIPKEDRSTLTAWYQFKFVIFSLCHAV